MDDTNSPREVTRRGFISDLAVGAGGALAISSLLPSEAAGANVVPEISAEWDLSWIDRLTGKYRCVFDSPDINEGTVFVNATVFMSGFQEVYGVTDADTQAVLVLRHIGVHLAFNDMLWEKYGLGTELKQPGSPKQNPYTADLARLRGRGATIIACSLAANRQAGVIARRVGADVAAVRAEVLANLVPGAILMPSGVFATIRAQQAGCSFMKSA